MAKIVSKSNVDKVKTGALYAVGAAIVTALVPYFMSLINRVRSGS